MGEEGTAEEAMRKWLPPGLAPSLPKSSTDWFSASSSALDPPPSSFFHAPTFTLGLGGPKQATSLVEQCAAFIARDFEFCLRAKLVLPEHLYLRVLHHTFTSKLPS